MLEWRLRLEILGICVTEPMINHFPRFSDRVMEAVIIQLFERATTYPERYMLSDAPNHGQLRRLHTVELTRS